MARKRKNRTTYATLHDWNVVDDVTGLIKKRSECRLTWDNLLVADDQWDVKHPQLIIKPKQDNPAVPLARPEGEIEFYVPTADEL